MSNRANQNLLFKIITPLGVVFHGEVDQITLTTTIGEITVLRDHTPLVSTLVTGRVLVRIGELNQEFTIHGGVLEVRSDNTAYVLSSRSESALDIDIERAQHAYEEAKRIHDEQMHDPTFQDYSNIQEVLTKELNRIKIAERGGRK